jgi:thiol-disulfide isomerase/thioredoxin
MRSFPSRWYVDCVAWPAMLERVRKRTVRSLVLAVVAAVAFSGRVHAQSLQDPSLDLSRWKGKVILLDFWASWCPPCRQSFPWMARMRATHGESGFVVVAVNLDEDPDKAIRFLKGAPGDFVHVQDPGGKIASSFGLTVMPTSLVFDRQGRPIYRHEGFHEDRMREYESHIVELLSDRGSKTPLKIDAARPVRMGVHPWQRDVFADPAMMLTSDPLESELDDHIYFSKEASSGGRGFGGGGCGCN